MLNFEIDRTTKEDRMRRRVKASTIHGWLRKWRGTFTGNERVRQKGRFEMKLARARREYDRKKAQAAGGRGGPFSFFRSGSLGNRRIAQVTAPQLQRHWSNDSRHSHSDSHSNHNTARSTLAKRKSSSSGANEEHPARHHSHDRPGPTWYHSSHSVRSTKGPSRPDWFEVGSPTADERRTFLSSTYTGPVTHNNELEEQSLSSDRNASPVNSIHSPLEPPHFSQNFEDRNSNSRHSNESHSHSGTLSMRNTPGGGTSIDSGSPRVGAFSPYSFHDSSTPQFSSIRIRRYQ